MKEINPLIESFIRSTMMVMNTMCGEIEISHEIVEEKTESVRSDIIGVMGISGNTTGTTILAFPSDIAETIVSMMTGYEPEELSESDINDGVTEALNMICGNSKAIVADTEYSFSLSLPTIISSSEYKIGYHHDADISCVRFNALGSSFYLYITVKHDNEESDESLVVVDESQHV